MNLDLDKLEEGIEKDLDGILALDRGLNYAYKDSQHRVQRQQGFLKLRFMQIMILLLIEIVQYLRDKRRNDNAKQASKND